MKEITQDDLVVGALVTVTRGPMFNGALSFGSGGTMTQAQPAEDRTGQGKVLRVLAVDLPFIVVADIKYPDWRFPLDTRRYVVATVSPEFIDALHGRQP